MGFGIIIKFYQIIKDRKFSCSEELTDAYIELLEEQLTPWIAAGFSAAIYTQTTDVEIEVNGYVTYDREVEKMDFERLQKVHGQLFHQGDLQR
jgi:hypothetical protein